jgi:amidophosphoribosyltransferase
MRPLASRPQDKCGVVGISFGRDRPVAPFLYNALRALQHRGQESAGITVFDGEKLQFQRGMGYVHEVLGDMDREPIEGSSGIGHTRYSTTGGSLPQNVQPFVGTCDIGEMALGHNGDIANALDLMVDRQARGWAFMTSSDSELILRLLANELVDHPEVPKAMARVAKRLEGAYCLCLQLGEAVYGVRDPMGIRPLYLGHIMDGYVFASESVAIDALGGTLIRDVDPGEVVEIRKGRVRSFIMTKDGKAVPREKAKPVEHTAFCMFEWVYFARPDSFIQGRQVYQVRKTIGEILAREHPVEADVVFGVPDSGRTHALGYSGVSGIEYEEGMMKNRYVGRTFILPDQTKREQDTMAKLNPISTVVADKRVIMVDDSIVRGTTMRRIVKMLRRAGATEVHVRIGVPHIVAPCPFGIDMKTRDQFLARGRTDDEIAKIIDADSVGYLSMKGLEEAIGIKLPDLCCGCLTEEYPVEISEGHLKDTMC